MKMDTNFLHVLCVIVALLYNGIPEGSAMINGLDVNPGEFKYMVTYWNSTMHLCGGAILDDWHVLTSAVCVVSPEKAFHENAITLVAGTTNFKGNESSMFRTTVEKIYVTDRYNFSDWFQYYSGAYDDIAVLKLRDKFNLQENPNLAAVELPEHFTSTDAYANKTVQSAGYGYQSIELPLVNIKETGFTTGELKKSPMLVIQQSECLLEFKDYVSFMKTKIIPEEDDPFFPNEPSLRDYQLCARMTAHGLERNITRQGFCNGDSGNPLVDGNTVIGIFSFNGFGCDDRNYPNIFTMVSHYLDFIKNAMSDNVVQGMRVSPTLPAEYVAVPREEKISRDY